jgi:hypothetical protein
LTAGETADLEKKEPNINQEIRRDRAQNGGNLTNNEKSRINPQQNRVSGQQQNKISGQIHNDKTH